jgi:hypothetical protein
MNPSKRAVSTDFIGSQKKCSVLGFWMCLAALTDSTAPLFGMLIAIHRSRSKRVSLLRQTSRLLAKSDGLRDAAAIAVTFTYCVWLKDVGVSSTHRYSSKRGTNSPLNAAARLTQNVDVAEWKDI